MRSRAMSSRPLPKVSRVRSMRPKVSCVCVTRPAATLPSGPRPTIPLKRMESRVFVAGRKVGAILSRRDPLTDRCRRGRGRRKIRYRDQPGPRVNDATQGICYQGRDSRLRRNARREHQVDGDLAVDLNLILEDGANRGGIDMAEELRLEPRFAIHDRRCVLPKSGGGPLLDLSELECVVVLGEQCG